LSVRPLRTLLAYAGALALSTAPAGAAERSHAYVLRLGADTLSIERVTRTDAQVRGEFVIRTPRSFHRSYVMDLAPDGTVRRFELVSKPLGGSVPTAAAAPAAPARETRSVIEFLGDSARVTVPRGDSSVTTMVAAGPGAVPSVTGVMGVMDQLAWQVRNRREARWEVALVPTAGPVLRSTLARVARDTLRLDVVTQVGAIPPFWLVTDREHRLVSYSGRGSVFQAVAERTAEPDFAAVVAAYASRPVGALSTRDTVRAKVGAADVWVDYGRPLRRGRTIFGDVVPWDQVWRTGANAATQLGVSAPVTLGGKPLAAGTYSVWTLPMRSGWQLIVNAQAGQWGTQHDPARDVLRVPLAAETLTEPVEQFTIALEPAGAVGALVLRWDRTRLSVPIAAAP
jgi:hypothetical protein